jgi:hypothetical protein
VKNDKKRAEGLNWKSLTQPAVLPIFTNFLASVKTIDEDFKIQSTYSLVMDNDGELTQFDSPESWINEMVSQRLSQVIEYADNLSNG